MISSSVIPRAPWPSGSDQAPKVISPVSKSRPLSSCVRGPAVPPRYADVELYVLAAAVPVFLLALFSPFRWRYLHAVERVIHAEAPASDFGSEPSPGSLPPLMLVSEHPAAGRI